MPPSSQLLVWPGSQTMYRQTLFRRSTRLLAQSQLARRHEAYARQICPAIATNNMHTSPPKSESVIAAERATSVHASKSDDGSLPSPLSILPLAHIVRTYLISSVSASPVLLAGSVWALQRMLNSSTWLTSVERNPLMKLLLRETFYKQFCAGNNKREVDVCVDTIQRVGFSGVILEYGREGTEDLATSNEQADVDSWRDGILECVDMANSGDYVGLKWTGMGPAAIKLMKANEPPSPATADAMQQVCKAAAQKGVRLLPAAEETNTLAAFHAWCLDLQRQFNRQPIAVVHNTYQAYLKCTAGYLASHLADAKKHGYTLGAKIVRGAYRSSEAPGVVWDCKERTDAEYDALAAAMLRQQYTDTLKIADPMAEEKYPSVNLVLATHNADSVHKAQAIRNEQTRLKQPKIELAYAQLQGMADEVSFELIRAGKESAMSGSEVDSIKVYKLTVWGTMTECLTYLMRRAHENKEAAGRTRDSKLAMAAELRRRFLGVFGWA